MLIVISPAKSLDYETPLATKKFSEPEMLARSAELVSVMVKKSPNEISSLMSVSDKLGELNFQRFQDWELPFTADNARPALLAFDGDVYTGMDAPNVFSERDFTHAQKTLRILSGLYGVLRPLDLMQPYRLEMGTRLKTDHGSNLYDFWAMTITDQLNADIATSPGAKVLVNLASQEYFGSVQTGQLDADVIAPVFLDAKGDGDYKIVSFFAKRARGAMAGWIIQNRVKTRSGLSEFDGMGYHYDSERSTPASPTFIRRSEG